MADGAGTCTITASQPGDTDWAAAPEVALDIDIARAIQHIAFGPQPDTVFGAEPLPVSAVADSGLPVSFETDGPCRILDGALVADGAGTCTITASQPGDADWEPAAAAVLDLDIARAEQAIEFAAIEGAVVGEPLPLSATADSGLPVSFEASGACVVEGARVRPIGSGTCTITASQPGDSDWEPAEPVMVAARIARGRQAIEVAAIEGAVVGEPLPLSATADSGLPVGFEASGPCRVLDGALILDGAGRCAITASQPGDIDWQPAAPVTTTVRVDRGRQSITLDPIAEGVVGGSVDISAVADSGLPVTFEADGPCRILDGALVADGAGTCTITASQPGDVDWAPAPDVVLDVDIARAVQAIGFDPVPDMVFGAEPLPLVAEADSGLPVTFETSGPCHILDSALVSQGAGICAVSATQPGDDAWQPAADVRRVFRIARAPQEITFGAIGPRLLGEQPVELEASASSGLPVTYSASGPCTVDEGILTILDSGSCSVSAFQAGDADWAAARQVSRSFPIIAPVAGGEIEVAVDPPGTLVASGAEISSALEPGLRDEEFYAIALEPGDVLELSGNNGRMDLGIMGPRDIVAGGVLWDEFELDDGSGMARWLAQIRASTPSASGTSAPEAGQPTATPCASTSSLPQVANRRHREASTHGVRSAHIA